MDNHQLQRTLYILLIIAALVYLFEQAYGAYQLFSHVVLLFSLAWLIAFTLSPAVDQLTALRVRLPPYDREATREVRMPRTIAVLGIYILLLVVFIGAGVYLVPLVLEQLVSLQAALLASIRDLPNIVAGWQAWLAEQHIAVDVQAAVTQSQITNMITARVTDLGTWLLQNIPLILSNLFNVMIDLTIILVMSFYMTLDGPQIVARSVQALPPAWRDDALVFTRVIDRRFGSFIRSLVVQGVLSALGTAVIMYVAGLQYIAMASLLAGVLIVIPLIGGYLAVIAPLVIALFHGLPVAIAVDIALVVWQQILFHVIMPRVAGTMIGLHPLVVFLAILVGLPIAGVLGALFAIPVAGVLISVAEFARARVLGEPVEETLLPGPAPGVPRRSPRWMLAIRRAWSERRPGRRAQASAERGARDLGFHEAGGADRRSGKREAGSGEQGT